jgi:hypothetical protein
MTLLPSPFHFSHSSGLLRAPSSSFQTVPTLAVSRHSTAPSRLLGVSTFASSQLDCGVRRTTPRLYEHSQTPREARITRQRQQPI